MSDAFFDKMIADLKEGAARSEGFMRGGRVGVEVSREHRGTESKLAANGGALEQQFAAGAKAAADHFGVKEAFLGALLPMAGSVLGGTAARAGLGMAAKRMGGGMMGNMAGKALGFANKGGIHGAAFDQAASMAGGAIGNRLAPQQPPQ
jgi:hypothetical protein